MRNYHEEPMAQFFAILVVIGSTLLLLLSIFTSTVSANESAIKTIAYEASNQGLDGMQAVANVIKTRMHLRKQTAEEVVFAPYQFSCWHKRKPTQLRELTDKELRAAREAWSTAYVWQYDHYAHYRIDNYWTRKAVLKKQIGDHVFYKL